MKRRSHRASQNLYLGLLAFFDMFMAGAYIPLMSLNLFADYFRSLPLLTAWYYYMIPLITVSHMAMTSSSFLIVAATFERFAITVTPQYTKFVSRHRVAIAVIAILLGFLTKLTMALEIEWTFDKQCEGFMTQWVIDVSEFARNQTYATYWKVLFRNIVTILLPFFLLLVLNIGIIFAYRRTDFHYLNVQKLSEAKRKQRVRAATRTLLLVVFTYLLSNFLNVIVTIWEYFDIQQLQEEFPVFYLFAVDVVSLLTIIAGALRLPIYVSCQKQLRCEFALQLKKCLFFANYWGYNHSKFTQSDVRTGSTDDLELGDGAADDAGGGGQYANLLMALGTALLQKQQPGELPIQRPENGFQEAYNAASSQIPVPEGMNNWAAAGGRLAYGGAQALYSGAEQFGRAFGIPQAPPNALFDSAARFFG
ncbi:unnamed protein product, partial [Mesorhabditis belari]|uniref:G-protein coupled receptors family 1 profile domain-containing protein n=1 Tax=Mesorhabditis belari TaxID=2138241 RepID=A0AAF3FGA4_9BILA